MNLLESIYKSVWHAIDGLSYVFETQLNFRCHLLSIFILLLFMLKYNLTALEWAVSFVCFSFILTSEIINTAFEVTCDLISIHYNIRIKHIKDMMAAAVLICFLVCFSIPIYFIVL